MVLFTEKGIKKACGRLSWHRLQVAVLTFKPDEC
ncbi:hypothetical protein ACVWV0_000657 [Ewingella americana]